MLILPKSILTKNRYNEVLKYWKRYKFHLN